MKISLSCNLLYLFGLKVHFRDQIYNQVPSPILTLKLTIMALWESQVFKFELSPFLSAPLLMVSPEFVPNSCSCQPQQEQWLRKSFSLINFRICTCHSRDTPWWSITGSWTRWLYINKFWGDSVHDCFQERMPKYNISLVLFLQSQSLSATLFICNGSFSTA